MPAVPIFDLVLGMALIAVAVRVLVTADLFQAVVLFIVFGLLMALAWTRLHAVDVALAEAAIGAGLTGALFLNALARIAERDARPAALLARVPMLPLGLGLTMVVGASLLRAPAGDVGLRESVYAALALSGASNPVTAVLLNFRAFDTLLEVAVLMAAVTAVWSLGPAPLPPQRTDASPGPVLLGLVRLVAPVGVVVAGYFLWSGTAAPGGAFQAGAVLGASGILLVVSGMAQAPRAGTWPARVAVVAGFAIFLAAGLVVMAGPGNFLEYPPDRAYHVILLVESILTVSIAAILVALFAGAASSPPASPGPTRR